jgi:glyceraldehyde 3-phosphate dehydrogenase
MATRIGINGFGRIGRMVLRSLHDDADGGKDLEIALINDLTDPATLAYLTQFDSVHGRFGGTVTATEGAIVVDGRKIAITAEKDPTKIPWKAHGVDIVLECTGKFTDGEKARAHLDGGARRVIISAPAKGKDVPTFCLGINADKYDPAKHQVISNASCTTNCLAPVVKVLHESFGIVSGMMTTVHSYTNDQVILDQPHKDTRRARAAGLSMIPTTTGAAKALSEVIPEMKGRLDGFAVRVPTPNVSLVDFTAIVEKPATVATVNEAFKRAAAEGPLAGVLATTNDVPNVSIDFNGDKHSSTVDTKSTMVVGQMVKVCSWYDNEAGYGQRLYELAKLVARKGA